MSEKNSEKIINEFAKKKINKKFGKKIYEIDEELIKEYLSKDKKEQEEISEKSDKLVYEWTNQKRFDDLLNEDQNEFKGFYSLKELMNLNLKNRKWFVDKIVPEKSIVFFGGTSGSYKTWIAMNLAMSIASGTKFLNEFETIKSNVLYIDEENGELTLYERTKLIQNGGDFPEDSFENISLSVFQNFHLDNPSCVKKLNELIEKSNPSLIIFDSMVRCMEGDENKAEEVRRVFENLKKILQTGLSILILHHTTKGGKGLNALRGSGDFAAFSDVVLMFEPQINGEILVTIDKHRHLDNSKFNKFGIKITSLDKDATTLPNWNGSIYFEYKPVEDIDIVQACISAIMDYIEDNDLETFRTGELQRELEKRGHKRNSFYSAIDYLIKRKIIKKIRRGVYSVENAEYFEGEFKIKNE